MTSYIKSKIQQVVSFPLVGAIVATTFCGGLLLNANPIYADNPADTQRALAGDKNLSGANLSGASLNGAELVVASLDNASLDNASLIRAGLIRAGLTGAGLTGVNLTMAFLENANLTGVNLTGAFLENADLENANLTGAFLTGAIANSFTKFPKGFDAKAAGVVFLTSL